MPLPHALQLGPSRTQPPGAGLGAFYPPGFQLPSPLSQPRSTARFRAERSAAKVKQCEWRRLSTGGKRLARGTTHVSSERGVRFRPRRPRLARQDPRGQAPPRSSAPGRSGPHPHGFTFVAGAGQEGPERGAQENAGPEGRPARCGGAAGQGRRGAGGPPASRTPGPRAPHLVLAASAAAVPRRSVHSSRLAEGAREPRGSSPFPVGSFTFGPAARPFAGTAGLLVLLKFASRAPHPPLHWG